MGMIRVIMPNGESHTYPGGGTVGVHKGHLTIYDKRKADGKAGMWAQYAPGHWTHWYFISMEG
jgi:hypothetical protein